MLTVGRIAFGPSYNEGAAVMMTLKHVDTEGMETVVSVATVSFDAKKNVLLGLSQEGRPLHRWAEGHAYLMNEAGKTVAVYQMQSK